MAMPIAPTPVLRGEEAKRFLDKIEREQNSPIYCKSTPKLDKIREAAIAKWGKK